MLNLQKRDVEILKLLREDGWVLSNRLAGAHFKGSMRACANRMRILEHGGLVEARSYRDFSREYFHERAIERVLSRVDPKTRVFRLGSTLRPALGRRWQRLSSPSMLAHQALLSHVKWYIENLFENNIMLHSEATESVLKISNGETHSEKWPHPDLVGVTGLNRYAIELERKGRRGLGKFNSAYDDRIKRLSLTYDKVLYIIEREDDLTKLIERGDGIRNVGFSSLLDLETIYRKGYEPISIKTFFSDDF